MTSRSTTVVATNSLALTEQQLRRSLYITVFMAILLPPFVGGSIMSLVGFYPMPAFYLIFFSYSGLYVLAVLLAALALVPRAHRFIVSLTQLDRELAASTARRAFSRLPWLLIVAVTLYSMGGSLSADYSLEALGVHEYTQREHLYNQIGLVPVVLITAFPIFFFFIDRLGRYLGPRGVSVTAISLWVKWLMLGIVTPLMIDSLLIGYYYNRTGYFEWETLAMWASLLALAAGGTWLAWRSMQQGMAPLNMLVNIRDGLKPDRVRATLVPMSLDELGVLTAHYAELISSQQALSSDLLRSRLLADSVIDGAGALVVLLDRNGRIVRFNRACERISGYAFSEVEGKFPWDTVLPPEDAEIIRKSAFEALAHNPQTLIGAYRNYWLSKSGERRLIDWSNAVLFDADGEMEFIVSVGTDVTESNRTQRQLLEQASIIDQIHDAVVVTDMDGRVISWNKGAERMFGYEASEMLGHPISQVYLPDPLLNLKDEVIAPLLAKGSHVAEVTMQRKNGERFQGHLSLALRYDERQQPIGMIGYTMDITDQKRIDNALRLSEERQRLVIKATNDGIWDWNILTHEDYLSPRWKEILGYRDDELPNVDTTFFDLIHPDDRAYVSEALARHFDEGQAFLTEIRMRHKDGRYRWVELRGEAVRAEDGKPVRMVGSITDITERRQAEDTLELSEARLNEAQFLAKVGSWELDLLTGKLVWSDEIFNIFEIDKALFDASYEAFLNTIHPEDRDRVNQAYSDSLVNRSPYEIVHRLMMGDGRIKHVRETCKSFFDEDGKPLRSVGTVQDITESIRAEEELNRYRENLEVLVLQRTDEMKIARDEAERANAAKSEFLSRMSHELRTPLNAILGFGQLLETDPDHPLTEDQMDNVHEILHAGDHLLSLVNEVLDLSRIESGRLDLSLEPVAIVPVVESCVSQVRPLAAQRSISIALELNACRAVQADRLRLSEVLVNLLSNAIKYNREGGAIHVRCVLIGNDRLRISVQDTGRGIAADALPRLFKSFERMESAYEGIEGSGIGLALAKKLVEAMHGEIGVESVHSEGSTFWFELPLAVMPTATAEPESAEVSAVRHDHRTILYIEDNPGNLRLVQKIFASRKDIKLLDAMSAEAGLEIAASQHPDLILLDINLPGMNGFEALRQLKGNPATRDIPVVAVTANAMLRDVEKGKAEGFSEYLTKPLDVSKLLALINQMLPDPTEKKS